MPESFKPAALVLDIVEPGTFIVGEGREWGRRIKRFLDLLEEQFFDANVALNLFNEAAVHFVATDHRATWHKDRVQRAEIGEQVRLERADAGKDPWADTNEEVDRRFREQQLAAGRYPMAFRQAEHRMMARAFVGAADMFLKIFKSFANEPNVPVELAAYYRELADVFPDLQHVRNSVQHYDVRAFGLGRRDAPMTFAPVETPGLSIPGGGALVIDSIEGSTYLTVMGDGHLGRVEVTHASLSHLQRALNDVLQLFEWKGPATVLPRI